MKVLPKQKITSRIGVRERLIISQFVSLAEGGRVTTTNIKAKALKRFADRVIGRIKSSTTAFDRDKLLSDLKHNKKAVLIFQLLKKLPARTGGYVSMIGAGTRKGDSAAVSEVSIIDFESLNKPVKAEQKAKSTEKENDKK